MSIWSGLFIAALLLSLNAFFVAAEFSLVAVNRATVEAEADNGSSHARRVRKPVSYTHLTLPTKA